MNFTKSDYPLEFETERLLVRRQTSADVQELFVSARDSKNELAPFLPWCHDTYSIGDSQAWIESVKPAWESQTGWSFGIRDLKSNEYLGGCGVSKIDEHPVANLGYWVKTSATGNGYAREATVGLARFALRYLQLNRIEIIMSTKNTASRNVAEKADAVFEGTLRSRLMLHGESHDAYLYSITQADLLIR